MEKTLIVGTNSLVLDFHCNFELIPNDILDLFNVHIN